MILLDWLPDLAEISSATGCSAAQPPAWPASELVTLLLSSTTVAASPQVLFDPVLVLAICTYKC